VCRGAAGDDREELIQHAGDQVPPATPSGMDEREKGLSGSGAEEQAALPMVDREMVFRLEPVGPSEGD
jgi:hypothetical protein